MNHFHPTILIVLVERHPPRPQQIKLKCWQMTQMAEQSQECEQQTLFQPCHSHALSQRFPCETVHLRIFIFFYFEGGFSAVINGNYVLPVYVIVTQLKGLQKCSCGRKIYIIIEKCGLTGQSFNRWGCFSSTAPKRAGK